MFLQKDPGLAMRFVGQNARQKCGSKFGKISRGKQQSIKTSKHRILCDCIHHTPVKSALVGSPIFFWEVGIWIVIPLKKLPINPN